MAASETFFCFFFLMQNFFFKIKINQKHTNKQTEERERDLALNTHQHNIISDDDDDDEGCSLCSSRCSCCLSPRDDDDE